MPDPEFSSMADSELAANGSAEPESVFSQRSGILDPLVKSAGKAGDDESGDEPEQNEHYERTERAVAVLSERAETNRSLEEESDDDEPELSSQQLRERQAQLLRNRRRKKKRQVFWNRIRLVIKLCCAFLWAVMFWELAHSALWKLDASRSTLRGQHLLTSAQIRPFIQPWMGKPLYQVDVGKISSQIQHRFPIVAQVMVRRRLFPARLDVTVTEKLPWAELYASPPLESSTPSTETKPTPPLREISFQERPYALTAGHLFIPLRGFAYQAKLYPGRTMEPLALAPSTRYRTAYIDTLRQLTWKARRLSGLHLLWTDARRPEQVQLHFAETSVVLGRLDQSVEERLARLIPLIPKINELHGNVEAVDLRWEKQVTLRLRPNAVITPETPEKTDG